MTNANESPLILVDGSSYLYRAFHALPALTNSRGEPTGAAYGVINMLRKLIADYQPTQMAVVFDAKGKTFRDDMYAQYKANRPPMPDELRTQIEPLHEIVQAMGLPMLVVPGVEADDVIGTLATQASKAGRAVVISTGDKDMAQLVDAQISLINTMSNTTMDEAGVLAKFGVRPERIIDYLALIGDTSDNVPGVPKVGPKTAVKWLQQYDSLDAIMADAQAFKGKVGEYLRESLAQLPLSRDLVTIRLDVALEQGPDALTLAPPDTERLRALYSRMEFKNWLAELGAAPTVAVKADPVEADAVSAEGSETPTAPASTAQVDYQCVLEQDDFERWMSALEAAELIAFDTETTDLDYMKAEVVGVSFALEPGKAAYVPLAHIYPGAPQQLDRETVLARLKPLLEDPAKAKLGHNLKYDRNVLLNHGINLRGIAHDTMLESYVLNSTAHRHDLDSLCEAHLQHTNIHYEDVAGKGAKQLRFDQVGLDEAAPYAAEDADMALQLHHLFWPQLQQVEAQCALYREVEMPLVEVLSRIERNGVKVDGDLLFVQSHELAERMEAIERQAHEEAGEVFNLSSPKQIQAILYEKKGIPVVRKTPKGQPSTAEDVLQELALDYPLPALILEYRSMSKLKSTYTDKLPERIDAGSGRVHTSYHQAVASTGRLSSSEPNLQNIPVRTQEGRRIRQAFIAPPGRRIVAADYSQIELRIMAHLSDDVGLLRAFAQGEDIHRATAAEVFATDLAAVSDDQRRAAKAINFGLIYGMSAFGLAKQLGIARGAAQDYVNLYFERYPGVKAYMETTREQAREQGYVETVFGRRLYLPEILSRNAPRRQYAERTAINAPMQGTAADIIKRAMISVDQWLQESAVDALMIMQVHDELVFEVPGDAIEDFTQAIGLRMEAAAALKVPLKVQIGVGEDWDQAH